MPAMYQCLCALLVQPGFELSLFAFRTAMNDGPYVIGADERSAWGGCHDNGPPGAGGGDRQRP